MVNLFRRTPTIHGITSIRRSFGPYPPGSTQSIFVGSTGPVSPHLLSLPLKLIADSNSPPDRKGLPGFNHNHVNLFNPTQLAAPLLIGVVLLVLIPTILPRDLLSYVLP